MMACRLDWLPDANGDDKGERPSLFPGILVIMFLEAYVGKRIGGRL